MSPLGACLERVANERVREVAQAVGVGPDLCLMFETVGRDLDFAVVGFALGVAKARADDFIGAAKPRTRLRGTRDVHEVAENPVGALGLRQNRAERLGDFGIGLVNKEKLSAADDHRERVVQLVSRAGGKFRQRGKLRVAEANFLGFRSTSMGLSKLTDPRLLLLVTPNQGRPGIPGFLHQALIGLE